MRHLILLSVLSIAFAGLTVYLGYFVERTEFQYFIFGYTAYFGLYAFAVFYLLKQLPTVQANYLLWLGLALRAILLFSIPNLSDDYARFLWDGRLTIAGIHPFEHPPVYFIEHQTFPKGISPELFSRLNSPNYFTVYPPVCQAVFALAAWCFPNSLQGGVLLLKLFLLGCEAGTLRLLARWPKFSGAGHPTHTQPSPALIYALNPLPILEICGNCHFEGAMIFFMLAGWSALQQNQIAKGAGWWSLAVASKMIPVMFLPMLWRWLGFRKGLSFLLIFAFATFLLFAPLLGALPNILESLDLYFRQFQFNASVYYLVREFGYWKTGWDIGELSGPWLGAITFLGVLLISLRSNNRQGDETAKQGAAILASMLFAQLLYLSLSATVHPWYIALLLVLGALTPWRFPIAWSYLVALSYSHYAGGAFRENMVLILLEYLLLWGFVIWDIWRIFVKKPA